MYPYSQVLPVGKELVACLAAFRTLGSCSEGKTALASILIDIFNVNERESEGHKKGSDSCLNVSSWRMNPPLLCCWKKLLISIDSNDYIPRYAIQAVDALSSGSLSFCLDGSRLDFFLSYLLCMTGIHMRRLPQYMLLLACLCLFYNPVVMSCVFEISCLRNVVL